LRTLFKEPKHPYTEALINAFPSITGPKKELIEIGGTLPDLRNPPSGCNFHLDANMRWISVKKKNPSIHQQKMVMWHAIYIKIRRRSENVENRK